MSDPQQPVRAPLLERWARYSYRHRGRIIGAWALLLGALVAAAVFAGGSFAGEFSLPGSESQAGFDLLDSRFPARSGDSADVVFEASAGIDSAGVRPRIEALIADLATMPGVVAVESPFSSPGAISQDGTIARASAQWDKRADQADLGQIKNFVARIDAANSDGLRVETGGDIVRMTEEPKFGSEGLGLLAAVIILFLAFGSLVAMGLPISAALFGVGSGIAIVTVLARFIPFPDFSGSFIAMIGIGVGIDYSLLVVTRFREGLHRGRNVEESVVLALTTAGRSVIFAGIVVAIAFFGLFAMGLPFIAWVGAAAAVVVAMAVLVALFFVPAMLSLIGRRIDSLRVPFLHSREGVDTNSGWYRLSTGIQKRPLPYAVGAAAILLLLGSPVLSMRLGFTDASNGSTTLHTRRAYDLLAKGFGPGYNAPLLVVVEKDGGVKDAAATVQNALMPGGAGTPGMGGIAQVADPALNPAGDTAVITVIPTTAAQDERTSALVHQLRDTVLPRAVNGTGAQVFVTGGNAVSIDISDRIGQRMPFLFAGVIGLSFILLTMVFRSILVALKAAVMNLLSIGAAYGVVVAVFQWGWGADFFGIEKGPVEVFLPMFFFAILFGLSMDYEVFLISRIREEYVRTKDNGTAVSNGLTATARVITAAAAIMVAVFLAFVLGDNRIVKEIGLGLAAAIFVDATIVRLILVPATMELLGDANWWLPGWLDRILPHLNVEGARDPHAPEIVGSPAGGQ
ncbi:MAG: MMPL family transporter [Chloroflexi bacterium]|nr:MMPL family transporter [Chloroflexota bacterium]